MNQPSDSQLEHAWQESRGTLLDVGYRLLGSVSGAEDATQKAFERLMRARDAGQVIENEHAWLVVVASRICLDELKSARAKRETYIGPWLPEPVIDDPLADPAERITLDETVSMGLLILLERLSPAERTAFVLHDIFGKSFAEIAEVVGRSEGACRQLASRARRALRDGAAPKRDHVDAGRQREVTERFLAACRSGELDELVACLDAQVVLRADGGGQVQAPRKPVTGAQRVAKIISSGVARTPGLTFSAVTVNGGPGMVMHVAGQIAGVCALTVGPETIQELDLVSNPAKLSHLGSMER